MIRDWIAAVTIVGGATFGLTAAMGLVRFPDLFTRMQAATKPGAVGLALIVGGIAVEFGRSDVTMFAVMVTSFALLTAPVAAHVIARAAYIAGVPLWHGTQRDDLRASGIVEELRRRDRPAREGSDERPR